MRHLPEKILERYRNMEPFTDIDDIPDIPQADYEEDYKVIVDNLVRCGAIPKKDLVAGCTYKGHCRNASEAGWDGNQFTYLRYKWGSYYPESIYHFEDDMHSDVFIPIQKLN